MSKFFAIKICPLCQAKLKLYMTSSEQTFYCPGTDNSKSRKDAHYNVMQCNGLVQSIFLSKYLIKNESSTGKSKFYVKKTLDSNDYYTDEWYDFVMEIPMITPDQPDKLLNNIKILLPFI